jgi:hypothetical protein
VEGGGASRTKHNQFAAFIISRASSIFRTPAADTLQHIPKGLISPPTHPGIDGRRYLQGHSGTTRAHKNGLMQHYTHQSPR